MSKDFEVQPGAFSRPCEFLRHTEKWAVRVRKVLKANRGRRDARKCSGLTDDAVRLLEAIEKIAAVSKDSTAAHAIKAVEAIDDLIVVLFPILDSILAS